MEQKKTQAAPAKPKSKSAFKKVSDWAGLLRNFATIITSLISLATLLILIQQNERTYRPDVVFTPEPDIFSVRYQVDLTDCYGMRIYSGEDSTVAKLALQASNLGLGAAKNLHIRWSYEPDRFDDTASVGGRRIATGLNYHHELKTLLFRNCAFKEPLEQWEEYCLPLGPEKAPVGITLPNNYLLLWCNLLIRTCGDLRFTRPQRIEMLEALLLNFQDLTFFASYQDINNKRYQKRYSLRLIPHFIDLRNRQVVFSIDLADPGDPARILRRFTISMYDPDGSFYETRIEL